MIKLMVIGNLGKDCVVNNVNNKNVINFSVAHTEKFKDSSGMPREKTIWVECAYWSDRTGIAPYLKKGTTVYVEGNPDIRTYTTQEGKQGASIKLNVQSIQLVGGRSNEGGQNEQQNNAGNTSTYNYNNNYNQQPAAAAPTAQEVTEPMDDLPF